MGVLNRKEKNLRSGFREAVSKLIDEAERQGALRRALSMRGEEALEAEHFNVWRCLSCSSVCDSGLNLDVWEAVSRCKPVSYPRSSVLEDELLGIGCKFAAGVESVGERKHSFLGLAYTGVMRKLS